MNYQVTARKWRPQRFDEIIGQDSLIQTIKNSFFSGKIPHAYLFSGVRGVGKTTTARIIAKAINCLNPKDYEPCNICSNCIEITNGYSLDVIEIDGASNRGIDNIRQIRDNVSYMPLSGKYKIYIIDEVHMLTNEASNALLKTLEEPPEHVIFILATTESHRVLPTIKSRCQHFVFKKIPSKTILNHLKKICEVEGIHFSEDGLLLIANASDGSLRDAESIFDQSVLYSDGNITEEMVSNLIGIPDESYFAQLIQSVKENDPILLLRIMNNYINSIGDIKQFVKGFINYLKNGLLVMKLDFNDDLLELTEAKYQQYRQIFEAFSSDDIIKIINLFVSIIKELRGDINERFLLEVTLFKMLDYRNIISLVDIRNEMLGFIGKGVSNTITKNTLQNTTAVTQEKKSKLVTNNALLQKSDGNNQNVNDIKDEEMIKKTIIQILSNSLIMKPMVSSIKNMHLLNNKLRIELSTAHTCEYFTKNKYEIQQDLIKIVKKDIDLQFEFNKSSCVDDNSNDIDTFMKKDQVREHDNGQDSREKTDSELVNTIADLFEGNIE